MRVLVLEYTFLGSKGIESNIQGLVSLFLHAIYCST